jgi:hypothetical protein
MQTKTIAKLLIAMVLNCGSAYGQELNNPNKLPLCPKPDYSKKTDVERFAKWTNCWGRYKSQLDGFYKGRVLEGEWLNGKLHGQGTYIDRDKDKYVGSFKDGEKSGYGTLTYANGDRYVGEFKDGSFFGQGTLTYVDHGICAGEWKEGLKNGQVTCILRDGRKYVGEYRNSLKNGLGEYTWVDGEKYVGEYKDDKRHGTGTHTFPSGDKYVGAYKDDKRHGLGMMTLTDGTWYYGEWENDLPQGQGITFVPNSGERKEGVWAHGELIREVKVNLPAMNDSVAANTDRTEIDRERQQLAEERKRLDEEKRQQEQQAAIERQRLQLAEDRKRLEEEKRQRDQAKASSRINLQVSATTPRADGAYTISIQTNADTASLKINGEEIGGRADGLYTINRIARAGQDTKLEIVATDVYNNSNTKTITVARQVLPASAQTAILKPETIKIAPARDAVAIIIGIQNYKRVPKAEFANNDAREFNEYAIRALGIKQEKIKMLVDEEADEVNIVKAFENWLPIQVNKDKTEVYVFYSGHGLPAPDGKSLYFLPHGVDKELLSRTAVAQDEIVAALTAAKPKSVTMFIDACYSGQTRGGDVLIADAKPVSLKADTNVYPPNFTVITASTSDQISSSSSELKHGIFSFYLMKGMEGDADANQDGKITVGEMQDYLSDKVARQATTLGRKQNTQVVGDSSRVLVGR